MINANSIPAPRWIHVDDSGLAAILIFADGATINNGLPNARASCGIVFVPGSSRGISFPMPARYDPATSNRAELVAAINALQVRAWIGEGFARIVVAMDSEYVVCGISEWVFAWTRRNWITSKGQSVANRDLLERLIRAVEKWEKLGVKVQFYLVRRALNDVADRCAKRGAVRLV
jgi:ribonuclease HI